MCPTIASSLDVRLLTRRQLGFSCLFVCLFGDPKRRHVLQRLLYRDPARRRVCTEASPEHQDGVGALPMGEVQCVPRDLLKVSPGYVCHVIC